MSQQPQPDPSEIILSGADINRAGAEGVISQSEADRLIHWAYDQRFKGTHLADPPPSLAPEKAKGFNLVAVLYYCGALLMISACAWFLGTKWDVLGASGICNLGVYAYLGHLAWTVFKDSVLFPFVLALLGLSLILGTVFGQHYLRRRLKASALRFENEIWSAATRRRFGRNLNLLLCDRESGDESPHSKAVSRNRHQRGFAVSMSQSQIQFCFHVTRRR